MRGLILVICGTVFWGIGGTIAQVLFEDYGLTVNDYVKMRLFISGILLLGLAITRGQKIFQPFTNIQFAVQMIFYSLFGMLAVQYTFMAAIQAGNAAVATLLQYLAPVVILIFYLVTRKKPFKLDNFLIIVFSMFGTFLLLTNGSIQTFSVSSEAIFWGLLSAVAAAYYIMYANNLFTRAPSITVIGWAMMIGGVGMCLINPEWHFNLSGIDTRGILLITVSIIIGTTLAFWLYLESTKYIHPEITALLGCLEPLTAVILSSLWLNTSFGMIQMIGIITIIVVVIYASLKEKEAVQSE